jgi:hypothetical protein
MCIRGPLQLEVFHAHLRRIISGFHTSPCLVTCLLALLFFRWNIGRAVERGIFDTKYDGWYNHDCFHRLQLFLQITPYEEQFQ